MSAILIMEGVTSIMVPVSMKWGRTTVNVILGSYWMMIITDVQV